MRYFPLFVDTDQLEIVILGGLATAEAKLRLLLRSQAQIRVYSPHQPIWLDPQHDLANSSQIQWTQLTHLNELPWDEIRLLYCALEDSEIDDLNESSVLLKEHMGSSDSGSLKSSNEFTEADQEFHHTLRTLCTQYKVWLNVVDRKELCDVITPAIVDRDPVVVAISTAGQGPMLGRQIRKSLETSLPDRLGEFVSWAGELRPSINSQIPQGPSRRLFWGSFFNDSIADLFYTQGKDEAWKKAQEMLTMLLDDAHLDHQSSSQLLSKSTHPVDSVQKTLDASSTSTVLPTADLSCSPPSSVRVFLVGAGPGDPKLLTLEAIEALEKADVLLIDRLVDRRILKYCRREARLIYVGKNPRGQSIHQDQINQMLVAEAQKDQIVVRLKGGDPMVFGRVVEEIDALSQTNIPYAILPGLSAAQVGAARLALPLTRRGRHRQCIFATGHTQSGLVQHPWKQWAQSEALFALYMSAKKSHAIQKHLIEAGFSSQTPVTIASWIGRPQQRTLWGTLDQLSSLVTHLSPDPMILYIGAHPYEIEKLDLEMPSPEILSTQRAYKEPIRSRSPFIKHNNKTPLSIGA